ncbi:MOSC domain-containing protein [Paenirhodobacter populi]|uniref:MOSC domain-containing protein n=1 Tax=Paenirhodobacter populi TaxID=2306993 RepID=A0A443J1H8_9RHOB|nr:MOSC N-terminal beta barrel domain-containing protein [Sinirhodobacter populi]RWR14324.1 MOSC domain-containing protein [Sinirhodobacter populi]
MTARLRHIFRHPIKSIGHEEIPTVSLTQGRGLPFDRVWAISTQEARFASPLETWAPKMNFVRGVAAPGLMAVTAQTHEDGTIELTQPDLWHLRIDPDRPADQEKLIEWLAPLWPANRPAPRAVEKPGVALADNKAPFVSILSLASLAALSEAAGQNLSPHRFRGNLWVDGWAPWAERDLTGRTLRIGTAEIGIADPIIRCRATCGNPETGREDLDMLALLKAQHGDMVFGLFGLVTKAGEISRDDPVEIL